MYSHIDEKWSKGLADFSDYEIPNNKGCRYIFFMIDNFSKFLRAIPLKINMVKLSQMDFQIF